MALAILIIIAATLTIAAFVFATRFAGKQIAQQMLCTKHTPTAPKPVEKREDGTYPEPPKGPEFFYGTLDDQARATIDANRITLDADRHVWAETHAPERMTLQAEDGATLVGYVYRADCPTNAWVLCVHGYAGSHDEMEAVAMRYCMAGYNALAVDLRAHGESEGAIVGMGWLDRRDIVSWCAMLDEGYGPDTTIVLHGWSMGAAAVMAATGESDLPASVAGCIEDCGYASFDSLFEMAFASVPKPIASLMRKGAQSFIRQKFEGIEGEAPIAHAIESSSTPTLFMHGDHDRVVSPSDLDTLYNACGAHDKKRVLIRNAGHCQAVIADTEAYFRETIGFADACNATMAAK